MCRGGDAQTLQELESLRKRSREQEAQLSAQEQIILALNAQPGDGTGAGVASTAASPATRRSVTPPSAAKQQEPATRAMQEDDEDDAEEGEDDADDGGDGAGSEEADEEA